MSSPGNAIVRLNRGKEKDPNDVHNFEELGAMVGAADLHLRASGFKPLRRMTHAHRGRMPPRSELSGLSLATPRGALAPASAPGSLCYGDPRFGAQQSTPHTVGRTYSSAGLQRTVVRGSSVGKVPYLAGADMVARSASLTPRPGSSPLPAAQRESTPHPRVGEERGGVEEKVQHGSSEPPTAKYASMPLRAIRVEGGVVKTVPMVRPSTGERQTVTTPNPGREGSSGPPSTTPHRRRAPSTATGVRGQTYELNVRSIAPVGEGFVPREGEEDIPLPEREDRGPIHARLDHVGTRKRTARGLVSHGDHGGMCNLGTPHQDMVPRPVVPHRSVITPRRTARAPAENVSPLQRWVSQTPPPTQRMPRPIRKTGADDLIRVLVAFQPSVPEKIFNV